MAQSLRLAITRVINNADAPSAKKILKAKALNKAMDPETQLAEAIAKANMVAVHPHTSTIADAY